MVIYRSINENASSLHYITTTLAGIGIILIILFIWFNKVHISKFWPIMLNIIRKCYPMSFNSFFYSCSTSVNPLHVTWSHSTFLNLHGHTLISQAFFIFAVILYRTALCVLSKFMGSDWLWGIRIGLWPNIVIKHRIF